MVRLGLGTQTRGGNMGGADESTEPLHSHFLSSHQQPIRTLHF